MTQMIHLPTEAIRNISLYLSLNDLFALHKTDKSHASVIKRLKVLQVYNITEEKINNIKTIAFLFTMIQNVNVTTQSITYAPLVPFLAKFIHLKSIDISGVIMDADTISRFLTRLNNCCSNKKITLKICRVNGHSFEKEIMNKNYVFEIDDTRVYLNQIDCRSRESTPEELANEDTEFKKYKQRVKEGIKHDDVDSDLRRVLDVFGLESKYKVCLDLKYVQHDNSNAINLQEAVNYFGSRFVEALLTSNDGCWLIITQVEVYYKDSNIDDCSNSSPVPKSKKAINFVVEKKGEGRSWLEAKIYVGKFEILLTGGIFGYKTDLLQQFDGFLGASASSLILDEQYWVVHLPVLPVTNYLTTTRLLRNYRRRDSLNQWAFQSKKFADMGFVTASPFIIADNLVFHKVVSTLVVAGSGNRSISAETAAECLSYLRVAGYWKSFGLQAEASAEEMITSVASSKLGVVKKNLLRYLLEYKEGQLENILVDLYNSFLYPHLKSKNSQSISKFRRIYFNKIKNTLEL